MQLLLRVFILFLIGSSLALPYLSDSDGKVRYSDQVAVLMYHHISDTEESSGTVSTKLFRDQLEYLQRKGYQFLSLEQFHAYMNGGVVPDNAVLVTFDDGYESFYLHGVPILHQLNIPAVNFLITETLDHPDYNPYLSAIPFLSREQVREMLASTDLIDVGCHTNGNHHKQDDHAFLTNPILMDGQPETEEAYENRILWDTQACLQEVSALSNEITQDLAYPFGISDEKARELIRRCGVKFAYTIVPEMTTRSTDPLQIPRINGGSPFVTPELLHQTIQRRIVRTSR
ncbi:polysaccharide deacetylase family protein [Paenibacillus koleovorans]|uniref:polysaccharide deacetylase family protein n=1 Tax=Paenibacillus koleovorans TaxID=121608 RepID=UPI000FD92280|nr:polysaccharide deacetylase family protein [Paenibacillus koleovorans]